jgi:hypothetical protein
MAAFKSPRWAVPLLLAVALLSRANGAPDKREHVKYLLSIRIELTSSSPPAGKIVLRNTGQSKLRVWEPYNSWGAGAVFFRLQRAGKTEEFHRLVMFSRNGPGTETLAPGKAQEIEFDLGKDRWRPEWHAAPADESNGSLSAVYEVPPTPESKELHVWTGKIVSEPVKLD